MSALRNDLVEYARLLEVPAMIAEPNDYSPAHVRRYLRRYHELAALADGLRGIRYDGEKILHSGERDPHKSAHIKADIDQAIGWLQQMDQRAALLVFEHYVGWGGKITDTATLADRYDLAQSSIHRIITAGIREMSEQLGWREMPEEAIDAA